MLVSTKKYQKDNLNIKGHHILIITNLLFLLVFMPKVFFQHFLVSTHITHYKLLTTSTPMVDIFILRSSSHVLMTNLILITLGPYSYGLLLCIQIPLICPQKDFDLSSNTYDRLSCTEPMCTCFIYSSLFN